jgi:hypothetical protein
MTDDTNRIEEIKLILNELNAERSKLLRELTNLKTNSPESRAILLI